MKKLVLPALGVAALGVTCAATFMRVEKYDGTIVKFDVEDVRQVDYVVEEEIGDTIIPVDTTIVVNYEYVDLGLPSGIKWATFNVGATKPEEYGDYFAWGETVAKNNFTWSNYKYATVDSMGKVDSLTKYNNRDSLSILLSEDDAATANWGDGWRTPTAEEWNELIDGCTTNEEYVNGVRGKLLTSKTNGNSIFIPFAGYIHGTTLENNGHYSYHWSSTLSDTLNAAKRQYMNAATESMVYVERSYGFSVRPVYGTASVIPTDTTVVPVDTTVVIPADTTVVPVDTTVVIPADTTVIDTTPVRYDYVDLGLQSGIKWATFNVGATKPEEYGDYFAWGETVAKDIFTWSNYKYATPESKGAVDSLTKYNNRDSLSILLSEDDAATANWGDGWRTPTAEEWNELIDGCTTSEKYVNGVRGKLLTSKTNGNSIFIPFAGYIHGTTLENNGHYSYHWSSTLSDTLNAAMRQYMNAATESMVYVERSYGFSVRPVYGTASVIPTDTTVVPVDTTVVIPADTTVIDTTPVKYDYVDLGLPSGIEWAAFNVGATNPEEYGDYFAWGETVAKDTFTWSNYKYATVDSMGKVESLIMYNSLDTIVTLLRKDDAATVNWGDEWRTPTADEWKELIDGCTTSEEYVNGVRGKLLTSKTNGNTIFLPFAGYRHGSVLENDGDYSYHWSSTLSENLNAAMRQYTNAVTESMVYVERSYGFSVRPVRKVKK